eukprot:NODE_281_length_2147_cov_62.969307_g275_i0.p2 GENE.NODE_281_length_2147_cov_62.969307_g275_i0~~NODE_281_length_2147_cov_62.969307_g275_i0.p2  ORF type:complete len:181 (-),score=29.71 NODE_281_length_2147_cov_62.969307_g275_i0:422-964(-)
MPSLGDYASEGNASKVTELLQQGGVSPEDFMDAFTTACLHGRITVVEVFLANGGKQRVNEQDQYGSTPLCSACYYDHHEVASHLLSSGADVNAGSCDGWSPLLGCSINGNVQCTELVLNAPGGLDMLNATNNDGWFPLFAACRNGCTSLVQLLLAAGVPTKVCSQLCTADTVWNNQPNGV